MFWDKSCLKFPDQINTSKVTDTGCGFPVALQHTPLREKKLLPWSQLCKIIFRVDKYHKPLQRLLFHLVEYEHT